MKIGCILNGGNGVVEDYIDGKDQRITVNYDAIIVTVKENNNHIIFNLIDKDGEFATSFLYKKGFEEELKVFKSIIVDFKGLTLNNVLDKDV